ncbi:MAG: enoyl-CoA hydratase/isomerase family protein [Arenicella sp.]|nr:enoyl-CoA hydratase/isomerase family protein [Arenicella sp.]
MPVDLNIKGHIAEIILSNPDKRNVLDFASSTALGEAVATAEATPQVNAIIVAAEGKSFCAGGSLDELMQAQSGEAELLNDIYAGFLAVADSPLPTIAAVQGAAVGAGMNLVLACDVRLVTPHAMFDTRFMQLGIHCGGGHSWMLQKYLNWEQSVAALVFGQVIRGQQAVEKGLALDCVEPDELRQAAYELASSLAGVPRELVEKTKQSLKLSAAETQHQKMVEHEFKVQSWSLQQDYAKQKLQGFKDRISGAKRG